MIANPTPATFRALRQEAQISQRALAKEARVNYKTVSFIETGKVAYIQEITASKIARVLSAHLGREVGAQDLGVMIYWSEAYRKARFGHAS